MNNLFNKLSNEELVEFYNETIEIVEKHKDDANLGPLKYEDKVKFIIEANMQLLEEKKSFLIATSPHFGYEFTVYVYDYHIKMAQLLFEDKGLFLGEPDYELATLLTIKGMTGLDNLVEAADAFKTILDQEGK